MRSGYGRFFVVLLVLMGINYFLSAWLASVGLSPIVVLIVICIASAFLINYINYPRAYRKFMLKDINFHKRFVYDSIVLIVLNLIFNFII